MGIYYRNYRDNLAVLHKAHNEKRLVLLSVMRIGLKVLNIAIVPRFVHVKSTFFVQVYCGLVPVQHLQTEAFALFGFGYFKHFIH
jgi:hypothetical protein